MMTRGRTSLLAAVVAILFGAAAPAVAADRAAVADAQRFIDLYSSIFQRLSTVSGEADWLASTDVTPEHDGAQVGANKAFSAFVGDPRIIAELRRLRAMKDLLEPLQVLQLDRILLQAAEAPGTIPGIVARRVEAESRQASILNSFVFCREPGSDRCARPITANEIDNALQTSRDLKERLKVWEVSKQSGPALKPGLEDLRDLRNAVAKEMGYSSFFGLQVADYGMTVSEMMAMLDGFLRDIQPLYEQLHCWAKHRLAERYNQPVPKRIPAHWIDNRWAQSWSGIVEAADLDPLFAGRPAEWVVRQAEAFYVSMGFPPLPESFWEKSDLYPVAAGSDRKKNTHASAWHVDLGDDVRSLMSVEPDTQWFTTAHHELGHIYYYIAYTTPEVPVLLREGANRSFHEGIGELIALASTQVPYLRRLGVLPADKDLDPIDVLLNEALTDTVPFIAWAAGTMSRFEHDLYEEGLPPGKWNERWWEYVARFQGVDPPMPRGGEGCDACTKTHISDDPAQYYDYAIANVMKYQLHQHICREILGQDPHACNYSGSRPVGDFLKSILGRGATEDWRKLIRETTGSEISTRPMLEYFRPLLDHLERENAGRACAWQ